MPVFGDASYRITGDTSQLQKALADAEQKAVESAGRLVSAYEKALEKLQSRKIQLPVEAASTVSSFDKVVDKMAEIRAEAASSLTPVEKELQDIARRLTESAKAAGEFKERLALPAAGGSLAGARVQLERIGEATRKSLKDTQQYRAEVLQLPAAMEQVKQATSKAFGPIKALSGDDPFVKLMQSGKSLEQAVTAITQRTSQLKSQISALQKSPQFLHPAVQEQLKALRKELDSLGGSGGDRNPVSRFLSGLSGAFDRFGQSVEEATGIAESDIAILLGAGLAGGFAGVIRIAEKFISTVSQALAEVNRLDHDLERAFKGGAAEVRKFSETTAHSLGVSTQEAQRAALAAAEVGRQFRFTSSETEEFARAVVLASGAIETYVPGVHTTEEAQKLLTDAVKGSEEALKSLGVTLEDLNRATQELFPGRFFGQLSEAQQNIVRIQASGQAAARGLLEAGRASSSFGDFLGNLRGKIAGIFTSNDEERLKAAKAVIDELSEGKEGTLGVENDFARLRHEVKGLGEAELLALRARADTEIKNRDVRIETKKIIDEELKALRAQADAIEEQFKKTVDLEEVHRRNLKNFRENKDLQRQALDAERALIEAQIDGARRVEDAHEQLRRTREDNARKYRDLSIQIQRDEEDAAHEVKDAEIELQEARDEGIDRIEDAEDRLADVRKQAFREQRDIKERIEDLELEHTRKVEDLQKRIAEAHTSTSRAVLEAQLDIEAAIRGTDEVGFNAAQRQLSNARLTGDAADSRLELERELADFERDRSRLKRDLHESEMDEIEEVRRAERDLDRARRDSDRERLKAQRDYNKALRDQNRAIEDAIRAMNDLEIEQNRALRDAKRALEEAEIQRDRAIAGAFRAFEALGKSMGFAVDEFRELIAEVKAAELTQIGFLFGAGFPGLQHGGPAHAGHPYVVGESGPELFVPNTSGRVFSNSDFIRFLEETFGFVDWARTSVPAGPLHGSPTFNIFESGDPRLTAFQVSNHLARYVRN